MKEEEKNQDKNAGQQVTDGSSATVTDMDAKMGAGATNTLANNPMQSETPGMQPGALDQPKRGKGATDKAVVSSQSLASSEMSVGQGAVTGEKGSQKNKEANPADMKPKGATPKPIVKDLTEKGSQKPAGKGKKDKSKGPSASADKSGKQGQAESQRRDAEAYGGNFNNSTQDIYRDHERDQNEAGAAGRGEFGSQGYGGTNGGYGNQYREPQTRGNYYADGQDRRYGGNYGPNGYHPDQDQPRRESRDNDRRPNYGSDYDRSYQGTYAEPHYSDDATRNPPARNYEEQDRDLYQRRGNQNQNRDDNSQQYRRDNGQSSMNGGRGYGENRGTYRNDNGSQQGRGGYSSDYGNSSGGGNYGEFRGYDPDRSSYGNQYRNQDEDYRSSRGGYDNQGPRDDQHYRGGNSYRGNGNNQGRDEKRGDNSRRSSYRNDYQDRDDRSGFTSGSGLSRYGGNSNQGYGSRGGSYDDEYGAPNPNSRQGSPDRGDYRAEDRNRQNYGENRREQYRNQQNGDNTDYGSAPRRNRGRDEEQSYDDRY